MQLSPKQRQYAAQRPETKLIQVLKHKRTNKPSKYTPFSTKHSLTEPQQHKYQLKINIHIVFLIMS